MLLYEDCSIETFDFHNHDYLFEYLRFSLILSVITKLENGIYENPSKNDPILAAEGR